MCLPGHEKSRRTVGSGHTAVEERGIETRPFFYPMHTLPLYQKLAEEADFPVADRLGAGGISLPTWAGLKEEDVGFVGAALSELLT